MSFGGAAETQQRPDLQCELLSLFQSCHVVVPVTVAYLAVLGLAVINPNLSLDMVFFVLVERKGKIHCHQHMGNVDPCLYREWFIYYVVISKGACTSHEVIIQLCPCWPDFPNDVLFCSSSCEVHVRSPVRFPCVSFRQFVTCMACQGGRQKEPCMSVSSTPQMDL